MTNTKYIISKYQATFEPERFEIKDKMAYENSEFDPNFIFEEFENKEEALEKMNTTYTSSSFSVVSSFVVKNDYETRPKFSVTDIVLNEVIYDDDHIESMKFIESSKNDDEFLNEYKYQIVKYFGKLVDYNRESEKTNNVELVFKALDKFYKTEDFVEIPFLKSYKNNSNYSYDKSNDDFAFLEVSIDYDLLEKVKFEEYKSNPLK